ncbi:GNAT family N-acetyltransferase [Pseudoduganella chitinolytica]|nr:GNAT family N-acetyltransferase [Pseudoduganella chitinolytica]
MTAMAHPAPLYRRATAADIPAMSAIRLAVTENVLSDPSRVTLAMYEDYLDRAGRGWVAELDGTIAAFCYADRADASIWALFVQPGYEGRGMAKHLLGLATDWLFAQGHERIRLATGAGTRADRFYAAQGWRGSPRDDGRNLDYVLERATGVTSRCA